MYILKKRPKIIAITGAESTGKSTLANALSDHYQAQVIPEFARTYVENLDRPYEYEDLVTIAKKQIEQLNLYRNQDNGIIILDTWLIITLIWFEVVYHNVPHWLTEAIEKTHIDLFLVCDTDLPWVNDPVRENGGEKRIELQRKYIEIIERFGFSYRIVSDTDQKRLNNALGFMEELDLIQQDSHKSV